MDISLILTVNVLMLAAVSCEENAPGISGIEPYFKVKLINQDSIVQLRSHITDVNSQIHIVNDTLEAIEERVKAGDETDYSDRLDSLHSERDTLNEHKATFNAIIKLINSGKMKITRLSAAGGAADIMYEDSLSVYQFPLNTLADSSRFFITIGEKTYTIKATYQRQTVVKERTVFIDVFGFNITDHSFDSINLSQRDSTNFSSNEATATVYF